ncbi:MAG: hypothetical protein J6L86_02190 [Alphaproteobacteria bacterium]|nr:hypothetical protein [Alphaproteobacteria bacterium]
MVYVVTSTEKTNQSASEGETKALLYLMNFHKDSDQIFYFVIDFFNDVTGIHRMGDRAWDIQSKASKNLRGKQIGEYLVTLYKNYQSDFNKNFVNYILFTGGFASTILKDNTIKTFNIENFNEESKKSIIEGLKKACIEKKYIDETRITNESIDDFLLKVTFVGENKNKSDYIKSIIKIKSSTIINNEYLDKIFDEIKKHQSGKKCENKENITINIMREFDKHNRHVTSNEIKMLVLSRLLHRSNIAEGTPNCFSPVLDGRELSDRKEIIEECKNEIFRMLFDKANASSYWILFEEIHSAVINNKNFSVVEIFDLIDRQKIEAIPHLTFNSTMFFIALVKDWMEE